MSAAGRRPAGTLLGGSDNVFYQVDLATGDRSVFFDANPLSIELGGGDGAGIMSLALEADGCLPIVWETFAMELGRFPNHLLRVDRASGDVLEDSLGRSDRHRGAPVGNKAQIGRYIYPRTISGGACTSSIRTP